jgi:hypothetical protein
VIDAPETNNLQKAAGPKKMEGEIWGSGRGANNNNSQNNIGLFFWGVIVDGAI